MSDINDGQLQSKIARRGFWKSVAALVGGFIPGDKKSNSTIRSKNTNIEFVKMREPNKFEDLLNQSNILRGNGSERLEKLFDAYLSDVTDLSYQDRMKLVSEIDFMAQTDPFISRYLNLQADEATQLDVQDNIISVEAPDTRLTNRIYSLFRQWGLTQNRIRSTIFSIAKYGDAFWGQKVSEKGVEKIFPLSVKQILSRLEFNPVNVMSSLNELRGYSNLLAKDAQIQMMIANLQGEEGDGSNVTDIFDTKLFGFTLYEDLVVPPWEITHFRINAEGSEMFPYGRTDLIDCLIPFKLSQSTQTLQALARTMSFPVHVYSIKTTPGMDEVSQFQVVEKVRQEYENVGVTPASGQSEVYSVNTKMWIPEGLVDLDIHKPEVDIDFVEDLEMYFDRVLIATGMPKGYVDQEFGGFGNSAISLMEQYKPFARKIYTLQSSFLDGLESLVRLHFALTGEFDYKTPFTLSMRFPAEEMSDDRTNIRNNSLDLVSGIIDALKLALGTSEEEELPPAVIKDILSKYSFLSPEDIAKWTNDANIYWTSAIGKMKSGDGEESGGSDLGADLGGGGGGGGTTPPEEETETPEEETPAPDVENDFDFGEGLQSKSRANVLRELHAKRFKELSKRYTETKSQIYINSLVENNIMEFTKNKKHVKLMNYVENSSSHFLEVLASSKGTQLGSRRIKETKTTLTDHINQSRKEFNDGKEDLLSEVMKSKEID